MASGDKTPITFATGLVPLKAGEVYKDRSGTWWIRDPKGLGEPLGLRQERFITIENQGLLVEVQGVQGITTYMTDPHNEDDPKNIKSEMIIAWQGKIRDGCFIEA